MMAEFKSGGVVKFNLWMNLSEEEARALDAMVQYGADSFLKFFYEKLGRHYLEPHSEGMRSLFRTIAKEVHPHLSKVDKARKAFKEG